MLARLGKPAPRRLQSVPRLPEPIAYLWDWFTDVLAGCQPGYGPAIVTWEGLACWSVLTRIGLLPWEARAIIRLGVIRANALAEEAEREAKLASPSQGGADREGHRSYRPR